MGRASSARQARFSRATIHRRMSRILHLKPGREVPLRRGHPWVMSGAVARVEGDEAGDEADVVAADGAYLGRATYHPASEIRARLFAAEPTAQLDEEGVRARIEAALARRRLWPGLLPGTAARLCFSESDGLPGLIVDRYGDVVVVQFLTRPWETRRDWVVAALREFLQPATIWDRSDVDARRHEGLAPRRGLIWGRALPRPVVFEEDGFFFLADVEEGHKTGFYLDQRVSRNRVAYWVGRLGKPQVLNVFAHTDAFGLRALASGAASVLAVDSSRTAAAAANAQYACNPTVAGERTFRTGDAFEVLRALAGEGRRFDLIVVDPPRLAARRDRLHSALRAYKDINLQACRLMNPGGLLMTFSCSGLVDAALFAKVIEGAARDAGRRPVILERLGQPPDHPGKPGFPESEYLKGLTLAF